VNCDVNVCAYKRRAETAAVQISVRHLSHRSRTAVSTFNTSLRHYSLPRVTPPIPPTPPPLTRRPSLYRPSLRCLSLPPLPLTHSAAPDSFRHPSLTPPPLTSRVACRHVCEFRIVRLKIGSATHVDIELGLFAIYI
jgi:hypothetical protein